LAKIDTGTRTSALHVEHLEVLDDGRLRFDAVVRERPKRHLVQVVAELVRWSRVRPSTGRPQVRPVVRTVLGVGEWTREVEISLVRRRGMLCRMLIGRTAMEGLTVDPTGRYLASEPPTSNRTGTAR
ncbi:MAG: RimK/LysX family protein, partial [Acidobacteriota bacterium]